MKACEHRAAEDLVVLDPTTDGQWVYDRAQKHYVYFFRNWHYPGEERYRRDPREITISRPDLHYFLNFYRWVMVPGASSFSGEDFTRASGDCVCEACSKKYADHPMAREQEWLDYEGRPYLRRLCNGKLVKL